MEALEIARLELITQPRNNFLIISVNGWLTRTNYIEFDKKIEELEDTFQYHIALDFKNLKKLDSSGIGLLVKSSKIFRKCCMFNIPANIADILRMFNLDKKFAILSSESLLEDFFKTEEN
jgi:anti-anti-sigma factor